MSTANEIVGDPGNDGLYIRSDGELCFATDCPSFCHVNLDHSVADVPNDGTSPYRIHGDKTFHKRIWGFAEEFADRPGALDYAVGIGFGGDSLTFTDPSDLRSFGTRIMAAAQWLEDNRQIEAERTGDQA